MVCTLYNPLYNRLYNGFVKCKHRHCVIQPVVRFHQYVLRVCRVLCVKSRYLTLFRFIWSQFVIFVAEITFNAYARGAG